jgi:tRNA(Ile)-lysidine synthase
VITSFLEDPVPARELSRWVRQFIRQHQLIEPGDRVLVAVSGGPDSVALLHLLVGLPAVPGLSLGVAHFDHGLRNRESEEDAAFVGRLAAALGLSFHLGRGDVRGGARASKISLQMAARKLRLHFLRETCRAHHYDRLALGHTADDQVELFFLRLLRGAGGEGLRGMEPASPGGLVRPLLAVGKAPLLAYLREEGLDFREDSSNRSRAYLRNRLRLDLLPELQRHYNPRLYQAIWRAQMLLQEDEALLSGETARLLEQVGQMAPGEVVALDLRRFLALAAAWQSRVVRAAAARSGVEVTLSAAQVASLLALARGAKSGGLLPLGPELRAARAGEALHLVRRLPAPPSGAALLPAAPCEVAACGWHWRLVSRPQAAGAPWPPPPGTAWLDPERVSFPLQVRYFQPGDRFWPLGAPGTRKLQDFLVDRKVPRWLRPHVPLLESQGQIVWVAGVGIAEPVKLTPASARRLEITISPQDPEAARIWEMLQACGGETR